MKVFYKIRLFSDQRLQSKSISELLQGSQRGKFTLSINFGGSVASNNIKLLILRYLTFKIETPGTSLLLTAGVDLWRYIFLKHTYNDKLVNVQQTRIHDMSRANRIEWPSFANTEANYHSRCCYRYQLK